MKFSIFASGKDLCKLHGQVFAMNGAMFYIVDGTNHFRPRITYKQSCLVLRDYDNPGAVKTLKHQVSALGEHNNVHFTCNV